MPSRLTVRLSTRQRQQLAALREGSPPVVWRRVTALLLLDSGVDETIVAQTLGISRRALLRCKRRWLAEGVASVHDKRRSGRPPRVSLEVRRELVDALQTDPRELGYAFTRWTAPRLGAYLAQKTGVSMSDRWVRMLIHRHGFVWRKTKRTLRNLQDPVATARAQRTLTGLKKKLASKATPNFGSAMESTSPSCL